MFPSETHRLTRRAFIALALAFATLQIKAEEPSPITRKAVESSNITSVGYDVRLRILEVEFHSGSVYRYLEVPKEIFTEIMAAESKGRYFTARIRSQYRFERVKQEKRQIPSGKP